LEFVTSKLLAVLAELRVLASQLLVAAVLEVRSRMACALVPVTFSAARMRTAALLKEMEFARQLRPVLAQKCLIIALALLI